MSIDVEEWFQTAAVCTGGFAPLSSRRRRRSPGLVDGLIDMLTEYGARATFFVLGDLLEAEPSIGEAVTGSGNELACHGWAHGSLISMDRVAFRADIGRCLETWSRLSLPLPRGYRAPSFSVTERNSAWVAEELSSAGFLYDSSVFPIPRIRYGIPAAPLIPYRLEGGALLELPLASVPVFGLRIPAAGGAWMRFMPMHVHHRLLRRACAAGRTPVLYAHPWEFDTPFDGEAGFPWIVRLRQGLGSGPRMQRALSRLLGSFDSITLAELCRESSRGMDPP
ncbi:MAG: DUF3473 domain-containing protein [Candidatus Fermentibacter sp.]|nr:DUF3473 domain-containing protein [Candidatus Fermentibacter sp.]